MDSVLEELRWRGLIHQSTDEKALGDLLAESQSVYAGFDPTATSLHCGSLLPLMTLRRFQQYGHRPIALVGGATGMIGDPSGKSEERQLLSADALQENVAGIKSQMERFLDFDGPNGAIVVNNFDWMGRWTYIDFLRDVGKNFPVNVMLAKDSVKSRLQRDDSGLSYTEFSYMLLQAYDFVHLSQEFDCSLQVGGSDQWGNITAGIDLARRMHSKHLHAMTCPLLLTSDGRKMGKTEKGAIWLDAEKTSPYALYQYWFNVSDADVMMCLRFLTEIGQEECQDLNAKTEKEPHLRAAQTRLAEWMTEFLHGGDGLATALKAKELFFGAEISDLTDSLLLQVFADVPNAQISRGDLEQGISVVDAFVLAGLAKSKSEARRTAKQGGANVNNRSVTEDHTLSEDDLASETCIVLRSGKKKFAVLRVQ